MERKYINWVGLAAALTAFILGFVVLFAKLEFLGEEDSISALKDDIDAFVKLGAFKKNDFASTSLKITVTQMAGWGAVILGGISFVFCLVLTLEEGGVLNTNLSDNKFIKYELCSMVPVALILIITGFIVKGGIIDTMIEEMEAIESIL